MQGISLLSVSGLLFLGLSSVEAASVINASDTGWYNEDGDHTASNPNYFTGNQSGKEYRNWFVFDLSGFGEISQATLRAFMIPGGYGSSDATETWLLREVSTDIGDLTGGTGGVSAFSDLGSGNPFGTVNVTASDAGNFVEVELNSQALSSLSAASGLWAIGGSVTTLRVSISESIFNQSHDDPRVELVVNNVPVPAAIWLFGSALIGLLGMRRKSS